MRIDGTTPPRERQRLVEAFPEQSVDKISFAERDGGRHQFNTTSRISGAIRGAPLDAWRARAGRRTGRIASPARLRQRSLFGSERRKSQSVDMALWRAIGNKVKVVGKTIDGMEKASLGAASHGRRGRNRIR